MAISKDIWDKAKALFMKGDSLSVISKETGISKGAIGKKAQKEDWKKETITTLAKKEIENIIIANEIRDEKRQYNETERDTYNEVFTDMQSAQKVFRVEMMKSVSIASLAQDQIILTAEHTPDAVLDLMPQAVMASKLIEVNHKMVFGNTETYKESSADENTMNKIEIVVDAS